ncbi:MAG: hypothetical protein U0930_25950 [Pirellulales bacterium]
MLQFFQRGNQWTMEHLKKQLEEDAKSVVRLAMQNPAHLSWI